jgi:outer membrane protein X
MRKIILLALLTLAVANGYSQKKGGFRVGLDFGYVPTGGGGGGMFSIEPKYNLTDNMNVGLRLGGAGIARDIQTNSGQSTTAKIAANGSFVGTYDYYFHKSGNSFVPYIGAGVGYYEIANIEFDDSNVNSSTTLNPDSSGQIGGLVRVGFEWGKFRMGVEYNFIPDSTLQDINGLDKGTVANSYAGIHLGFFLGGGKWGRKAQ